MNEVILMSATPTGLDAASVTAAFTTAVSSTMGLFTAILPIGLTVFAAVWGVKKAMQFFKTSTN